MCLAFHVSMLFLFFVNCLEMGKGKEKGKNPFQVPVLGNVIIVIIMIVKGHWWNSLVSGQNVVRIENMAREKVRKKTGGMQCTNVNDKDHLRRHKI